MCLLLSDFINWQLRCYTGLYRQSLSCQRYCQLSTETESLHGAAQFRLDTVGAGPEASAPGLLFGQPLGENSWWAFPIFFLPLDLFSWQL